MSLVPARAEMRRAARKLLGKGCNAFWLLSDDRSARHHGRWSCLRALSTGQFFPLMARPSPLKTTCLPDPAGRTSKTPQLGLRFLSWQRSIRFKGAWRFEALEGLTHLEIWRHFLGAGGTHINYWLNRKTQQRHLSGICSPGSAALITGPLKSPASIGLRGRKKVQRTAMQIRPLIRRLWSVFRKSVAFCGGRPRSMAVTGLRKATPLMGITRGAADDGARRGAGSAIKQPSHTDRHFQCGVLRKW